jgi:3',5'-cyclic AMP phosphodiesterase CpdA
MKPVLLAQLSDLHLGANWEGVDPQPRLEQVIEAVRALPNRVDAVIVSGDLTDSGGEEDYLLVKQLLARLEVPVHVLPGNHDLRGSMRRVFELPGDGEEPINYSVEVGDLRLIVFDSIVPGEDRGVFDAEQLRWLDDELGKEPERPTILAMHHPPLATGIPEWDGINLVAPEREALAEVVGRHPQLRAIVGGHLHRVVSSALAGCPVLAVPSTYLQILPDFDPTQFEDEDAAFWTDPPGFALHVLRGGELSSQVELLGPIHAG